MKQKIEWYREVLEIEPNSKIFFPLSRMLTKDGRPDEAIAVLRQGVGRHPDHVEARLFLVELLYTSGRVLELQQEVDVLSDLFKNYPGFWRAWGERLFGESATRDAGLAAIFLAAFLQNLPVSWAGVIEHGLKSLVGGGEPPRVSATVPEAYPLAAAVPAREQAQSAAPPAAVPPVLEDAAAFSPVPASVPVATDTESGEYGDDDEMDEPITLRTRSMAEVLAEQGDIAGALDIYNELFAAAGPGDKKELHARIEALSGRAAASGGGEQAPPAQVEKKDWLAILAQRLEARSLQ